MSDDVPAEAPAPTPDRGGGGGGHDPRGNEPPVGANPQQPTPDLLRWAYCHAVFPMAEPGTGRIGWYSPEPRGIIPLSPVEAFRVPRNLAREVRRQRFEIVSDRDFEAVIRACDSDRDAKNRSWLNERLIQAYIGLHRAGNAHSVEARLDGALVGGLYGVHISAAFFGESMFSRPDLGGSNASKVCLVHLVRRLQRNGFMLLDTQFWNPHLDQFGCIEIDGEDYDKLLHEAVRCKATW